MDQTPPEELRSGDTCVCGQICLHAADARKRVRRTTAPPGGHYQALPCKRTDWWHVYYRTTEKPTQAVRKRLHRYNQALRRKIEGEG
jgi:hypothetical protein